ncbi:AAA family ATPase [Mycoplasmatota bacterium]|nr:AAA family ATPase [Mycoplasmatota bacterium]
MKKLTRVRLINWHYFANETIDIKNNTLITGQNATGKSTIVDAIAFVLTAGDQIFNLAANDKSKRDLRGYVKCKLGIDNQEYLRAGDTTGHIALEFYDEVKQNYFTVGTIIDIVGEIIPPKVLFYEYDDQINENLFVDDEGVILTTINFKKTKQAQKVHLTRKEAKYSFRKKFGSINENYFSLLPKALAFKPISDVKEFIYKYLLEERVLDVESIKESIRSYKDLEATLKIIKEKVSDLDDIAKTYEEIQENISQKEFYEYFLQLLEIENIKDSIDKENKKLEKVILDKEQNNNLLAELEEQLELLDERSKEVYSMLSNNDTFKADEIYDKEMSNLTKKINEQTEMRDYAKTKAKAMKEVIEDLNGEFNQKAYKQLSKIDLINIDDENYESTKLKLIQIEKDLNNIVDNNRSEYGKYQHVKQGLVNDINDVYQTLKGLENNKLKYDPMTLKLQSAIIEGVKQQYNVDINVHILCELLEITDPKWQDTIEDYLGRQRFNLIVEPRYFDLALSVYNQIKDSLNIYGIGLVNTKKIQKFDQYRPNSLASIIDSDNKDAKHFINMTCGNLIMVDQVSELENYSQAITLSGMVYRSFTVRSLYKLKDKPFIGKNAKTAQLDTWRKKAKELSLEHQRINNMMSNINEENLLIKKLNLGHYISMLKNYYSVDSLKEKRKTLAEKKRNLPQESLKDLRVEYENIREEIRNYNVSRQKAYEKNGSLNNKESNIHDKLLEYETSLRDVNQVINEQTEENPGLREKAEALFKEELSQLSIQDILESYSHKITRELNNINHLEDSLRTKQIQYTQKYNLSYQFGLDYIDEYLDERNKLVKSELVKYESKVREAREVAEKLFKEDFMSKLRNYIISAQEEIKKINETLENIRFGEDSYEFIFPKSKEYGDYYDMVLSDEAIKSGEEIFNYDFEMKYQRQLEELFINLASEDLNSKGSVNKFTDYRTYMDYDILITNKSGDKINYSKVFKEKSGGETQVPFYVATLASFVRVFEQASRKVNQESIGLILFDEVFDKMDSSRIKAMMKFIQKLPVQIMLSTPPQKMEILQKYTDTTVITLRDGKKARTMQLNKQDA